MDKWVLGVNLGHDRSACLLKNDEIFVAIEEERIDRIKHSIGYIFGGYLNKLVKEIPIRSITYCLDEAKLSIDDLDLIVGNIACNDVSLELLRKCLPIKNKSKIIQLPNPSHHLAHAYNSYYASGFKDAAVLVADGMGSFIDNDPSKMESETMFIVNDGKFEVINRRVIDIKEELSLGLFYNYITTKIDFITPVGNKEFGEFECGGIPEAGKTMGLSSFGENRDNWNNIVEHSDGHIKINYKKLVRNFELTKILNREKDMPKYEQKFYTDWSYKVQKELEDAVIYLLNKLHEKTGMKKLCLSGGIFLNSVLNYKITRETPFEEVYVFPATNDSGIAVGCAYYGYFNYLNEERTKGYKKDDKVGYGKKYSEKDILDALTKKNIKFQKIDARTVAEFIKDGEIVAFYYDRSEFGPRALGHRSILASAELPTMKDTLNARVKFREAFRPFAPVVLLEDAEEYFDINFESPHMLFVAPVKKEWQKRLPGITHVDGTARLQTVKDEVGPLHEILKEYKKITGISVALNTSYNVAGQPIVETPLEAIDTFMSTNIDKLIMWPYMICKEDGL